MLTITTERVCYAPGEVVRGIVTLVTKDVLDKFAGIQITISGNEYSRVESTGAGEDSHKSMCDINELCNIEQTFPQGSIEPTLLVGTYEFPFTFMLPEKLPHSYHYQDLDCVYEVNYVIHGNVKKSNPILEKIASALKHDAAITITILPDYGIPLYTELTTEASKSKWFLFSLSKAKLTASVKVSTGIAMPGQNISLVVDIDNRTRKNVTAVGVHLQREYQVQFSTYHNHGTVNYPETIVPLDVPTAKTVVPLDAPTAKNESRTSHQRHGTVNYPETVLPLDVLIAKNESRTVELQYQIPEEEEVLPAFSRKTQIFYNLVVVIHSDAKVALNLHVNIAKFAIGCHVPANETKTCNFIDLNKESKPVLL